MNHFLTALTDFMYRILASTKLFILTIALLAFQSIWLAFSAVYPMPFDEYVHFGMTTLYANQWLPFISSQPLEASIYGDITRDPSYLFSYALSFPYRIIEPITDSQTAQIISLRLLNILFVCIGLVLFRKLLLSWHMPKRITHLALLVFVCTPIVPFLAAHINYDNAMFMMTPLFLIVATKLMREESVLANGFVFLIIGMTTSLLKHNFLAIFLITGLYIVILWLYRHKTNLKNFILSTLKKRPSPIILAILIGSFLLMSGLFIERHGVNVVRYGSVAPDCAKIQSEQVCEKFMPWYRNRENIRNKPVDALYGNPVSFSQHWVTKIMRGYFAFFSHTPRNVVWEREPFGPIASRSLLPLQITAAYAVLLGGVIATFLQIRKIIRNQYLRFMLVLCFGYLVTIWIFNFLLYQKLGQAQAIQARYTLPILILLFVIMAQAINMTIRSKRAKALLVLFLLPFYIWGGGIAGYIIRADNAWYWDNSLVTTINWHAQNVLRHVVVH